MAVCVLGKGSKEAVSTPTFQLNQALSQPLHLCLCPPCPHSCLECLLLLCFVDRISCSASDLKLVPEDCLELILELLKVVH